MVVNKSAINGELPYCISIGAFVGQQEPWSNVQQQHGNSKTVYVFPYALLLFYCTDLNNFLGPKISDIWK